MKNCEVWVIIAYLRRGRATILFLQKLVCFCKVKFLVPFCLTFSFFMDIFVNFACAHTGSGYKRNMISQ